jgi:hypothetical protein
MLSRQALMSFSANLNRNLTANEWGIERLANSAFGPTGSSSLFSRAGSLGRVRKPRGYPVSLRREDSGAWFL